MPVLSDSQIQQIHFLRSQGKTLDKISTTLGISVTTVQRYCAMKAQQDMESSVPPVTCKTSTGLELSEQEKHLGSEGCKKEPATSGNEIKGVINSRSEHGVVTRYLPDYRREVTSTPVKATYKFGSVVYTIDNEAKTLTLDNLSELQGVYTIKDLTDLLHYAEAVVGICKTLERYGKVKTFNED